MDKYLNRLIVIEHFVDVPGYEDDTRALAKATKSQRLTMTNPGIQGRRMLNPVYGQLLDGTYEAPTGWQVVSFQHHVPKTWLLLEMKVSDTAYRD